MEQLLYCYAARGYFRWSAVAGRSGFEPRFAQASHHVDAEYNVRVATEAEKLLAARNELERVLRSETFRNSDALRNLLSYLGEKSLADPGEDLKEYTIGVEACGKPQSYDPQRDASVRVQVGRLRQKLEEYYKGEGSSDPLVLELPKGRFTVLFHKAAADARAARPGWGRLVRGVLRPRLSTGTVILLVLLSGALSWGVVLWRQLREYERRLAVSSQAEAVRAFSPLWGPFLSHTVPSAVVFGSPPFFASLRHGLFVRLYSLKDPNDPRSSPEFSAIESKVGPLDGPRYDYASMGDAVAVQRLTAFFGSAGVSLRALPAHLAVWESVKDDNLIFIGAWRMHPLLRRLPVTQDFELGAEGQIHNRKPQPGEERTYMTPDHRNVMTYAVVGLYPGLKPGREILIVSAHNSPGAMGAVDFITSAGSLKFVQNRIGLSPAGPRRYFQLLLRTYVDNDVPVKTEYVTHHMNS